MNVLSVQSAHVSLHRLNNEVAKEDGSEVRLQDSVIRVHFQFHIVTQLCYLLRSCAFLEAVCHHSPYFLEYVSDQAALVTFETVVAFYNAIAL